MVGAVGGVLIFIGLLSRRASRSRHHGQAIIEMFDTVLRLGSNIVSFTRLAAFGLTHAVITEVVWDGSVCLWDRGARSSLPPRSSSSLGNVAAFALGGTRRRNPGLRLEYYEMFSRLFSPRAARSIPGTCRSGPRLARRPSSNPLETP